MKKNPEKYGFKTAAFLDALPMNPGKRVVK
jgi:hypothetical protein